LCFLPNKTFSSDSTNNSSIFIIGRFKTIDGNVLTLRPALVITQAEMDRTLDILEQAIGEVERGEGY
jgi:DNA-binding XRE family transcriptional regulator